MLTFGGIFHKCWNRRYDPVKQSVGVRVPRFPWRSVILLNETDYEEKKRDPRLLEEKEGAAA